MAATARWARTVHRITSYLIGIQIILWIAGGVTFAWVPFNSIVKGGATVRQAEPATLPADWLQRAEAAVSGLDGISRVATHPSAQGPLMEISSDSGTFWLALDKGAVDSPPSPAEVRAFAQALYIGDGEPGPAELIEAPESRMFGLVDELYGRTGVWQVPFDDFYDTRLYFDGDTGRYLTVRNDFWVFYDAMWRLHVMDYENGEDFNNPLLVIAAGLAAVFAISGIILTFLALQRAWRRARA